MLKVFLNHLTLGNSSVIEQMEKLYILISLTALFAFSSSLCVTEDEGKDGIDLRCSSRWSGEGSKIRRLIVHSWDGSCHFPEGGLLTLYGADQDCFTCSKSIHERMMVNGEKCTVAVPTARSESKISGSSRTTTGSIDFTTELYEAVWQVKGSIHGTTTTAAETYSASSSLQDSGSIPRWTYGLLSTLAVTVLVLFVLLVLLLLRYRRQRAYICCKPRTSPSVSMESVMIYPLPTLQL
ncbi:uncharacterized protein LOC132717885 isoform X2 [Ruditapes philippinarum]|uniref:uncharacterized protein LOC132717885 isoform X2 n=1 Tax=Ruditapes philippinarum TaxID=129788 RepID=UPI00295ACDCA|nr:uncharacterized protein LOC132717885 isoform X2 [Ruditapes philippinarum]